MKITEAELDAKIAELRGWKETEVGACGFSRVCWVHPDERVSWHGPPAFSSDMNLATTLLREIGSASLELYKGGWLICVSDGTGWNTDNFHPSNPAALISAVWLTWRNRNREVYEVIE